MYYLILVLPAMLFAMWANAKVNSTYREYSKVTTYSRMTGYEAARRILDANGLRNVTIEHVRGELTDHYDPRTNVLRLSDGVYYSDSVAAIGVAAHESGHAVQYRQDYLPVKIRTAILPVCNFGSQAARPIMMVGLVLGSMNLFRFGILLFSLIAVFQFVTLPVEFNASDRAMAALESSGSFTESELDGAQNMLWAAGMTYVAALAVSLANVMRLLLISNRRNR